MRRSIHRLLFGAATLATILTLPAAAHAGSGPRYVSLECINIRRLSDNFLLDLRVRLLFDQRRHQYQRYENAGRGWQLVETLPYIRATRTRIWLDENQYVTAYIERLTGDYYYIDRSDVTLSTWGRCNSVGPLWDLF